MISIPCNQACYAPDVYYQAFWPSGVEPQHPVANNLKPDTSHPGSLRALGAVINFGQGKKPTNLYRIFLGLRQTSQKRPIRIITHWYYRAVLSLKCGYKTISEIWYASGDQSVDFNFYTKRVMLAPVLASTVFYWLADEGDREGDFPDTWDFLDRRIGDVLNLMGARIRMAQRLEKMPSPFSVCKRFATATQVRR